MRSSKGLPLTLAVAGLIPAVAGLSGCTLDDRATVNQPTSYDSSALPVGAERVKDTLDAVETREQFRDLSAEDYVVQPGDTLWSIANRFLKDPYYWPEIWYANPEIENPHRIYPGDHVSIVFVGDRPRLTVSLRPHIRYESLPPAVSALPLDKLRPFLSHDQVLDGEELETAPYVLATREGSMQASSDDIAYVRPPLDSDRRRYAVVKKGKALVDSRNGDLLGYRAIYKGEARLQATGDPSTVELEDVVREVQEGDRLVEMTEEPFDSEVQPQIPAFAIDATIILLPDAITQVGNNQVIVIDRGAESGVRPGHLLKVSKRGRVVADRFAPRRDGEEVRRLADLEGPAVALPDYPIGTAMVFRVYDRVSFALVARATKPIHVGDRAHTPMQDVGL
jgi:hypothetical protein